MNERMQGRQQIVAQSRLIDERIDGQNQPWRVQRNGGIEYANDQDVGRSSDYGRDCHHRCGHFKIH